MKFFNRIRNFTQKLSKKTLVIVGTLIVAGGFASSMVKAEFYPDRTPFDYNKPCNPNDADIYDRCGSLTGPVFNSFINTPSYGDERQFVDARRTDQTTGDVYKNVLPDVTDGSKVVQIRMYVHNNANQDTNASGLGVAKNTKVKVFLPTATDSVLRARGYISADNATMVEDTVDFTGTKKFHMEYISGSAKFFNNGAFKNGVTLNDSIVTTGALIGDDALNGTLPGCFEHEGMVYINVRIVPEETPKVEFSKEVGVTTKDAQGQDTINWGEEVKVKPNDTVKWLVSFTNKNDVDLTNVNLSDKLPPHLSVVPNSVRYIDAAQDVVQSNTQFFTTGGINFGTWKKNGGFYVRFDTKALDDFDGCEVRLRNIAYNDTDQTDKGEDSADVVITKDNCQPPAQDYKCEALTLSATRLKIDDKVKVTAKFAVSGGATFKQATFTFGDEKTPQDKFVTNNVTDNNTVVAEHAYKANGTYGVSVKFDFNVNDQTKSVEGGNCVAQLKVESTPPTTLPSTGPGNVIGIFAAVTAVGYLIAARRYSRQ